MSNKARRRVVALILVALVLTMGLAAVVSADEWASPSPGPAPGAGDGVSDGSGWDDHSGDGVGTPSEDATSPGPAPNAGDGVSVGPGWE